MSYENSTSMNDLLAFIEKSASGKPANCSAAMFYFLYKEILVNRMMLLENAPDKNSAGKEHYEKMINELNFKLMDAMKK